VDSKKAKNASLDVVGKIIEPCRKSKNGENVRRARHFFSIDGN
jgi:hypothetical protein